MQQQQDISERTKSDYESDARRILEYVADEHRGMIGMDDVIRLCLVALFTNGHVLLEGKPGLGKTALVRRLSEALTLPSGRIQFTPDLMPSDITGTKVPFNINRPQADNSSENGTSLVFEPGPIFTSVLLADEINRATPKTQAAMLEAMAERQVTVLGTTYTLDSHDARPFIANDRKIPPMPGRPFMVMATQNPIEQEGTYTLPEAQADRFMFKVLMPLPNTNDLMKILKKEAWLAEPDSVEPAHAFMSVESAVRYYQYVSTNYKAIPISNAATVHMLTMYHASNQNYNAIQKLYSHMNEIPQPDKTIQKIQKHARYINYGMGPRAPMMIIRGIKAWKLFFVEGHAPNITLSRLANERPNVSADIAAMTYILLPVLRHRLQMTYEWGDKIYTENSSENRNDAFERYLGEFACVCAAAIPGYGDDFQNQMMQILNKKMF